MKLKGTLALLTMLMIVASCGQEEESESKVTNEGVLGTSCWAQPIVLDKNDRNTCFKPDANWPGLTNGELFYAGLIGMATAKDQAIDACISANALDYGTEYFQGGCAQKCRDTVSCLAGTNQ